MIDVLVNLPKKGTTALLLFNKPQSMDSAEEPNFETPLTSEIDESPLCQLNISHQQRERRRKSNEKKKRLEKYLLGYLEVRNVVGFESITVSLIFS